MAGKSCFPPAGGAGVAENCWERHTLAPHLLSGAHAGQGHQWEKMGGCQVVLFLFPPLLQLLLPSVFPPSSFISLISVPQWTGPRSAWGRAMMGGVCSPSAPPHCDSQLQSGCAEGPGHDGSMRGLRLINSARPPRASPASPACSPWLTWMV